jgi:hypothetical protein
MIASTSTVDAMAFTSTWAMIGSRSIHEEVEVRGHLRDEDAVMRYPVLAVAVGAGVQFVGD